MKVSGTGMRMMTRAVVRAGEREGCGRCHEVLDGVDGSDVLTTSSCFPLVIELC